MSADDVFTWFFAALLLVILLVIAVIGVTFAVNFVTHTEEHLGQTCEEPQ